MHKILPVFLSLLLLLCAATASQAYTIRPDRITITGYDLFNAPFVTNSGRLGAFYNGTETLRTNGNYNYTGASSGPLGTDPIGTLVDGDIYPFTNVGQQVFDSRILTEIVLYLDGLFFVDEIMFFGGNPQFPNLPLPGVYDTITGTLTGVTVRIDDNVAGEVAYDTNPMPGIFAAPVDDQVLLSDGQKMQPTGEITLRLFTSFTNPLFGLSEIELYGEEFIPPPPDPQAPVPEPSSILLVGLGLAALIGVGRKRFFSTS